MSSPQGYSDWMSQLVAALSRLPGIGRRSAERIVFYLLKTRREEIEELSRLLIAVKDNVLFCEICHNFSNQKICHICRDPGRDPGLICIVEDPKDVIAIEKTGCFVGLYHVLLGALSALEGIGPSELKILDLVERIKKGRIREVILATNPNTEGETTALYIAKALKPLKVKISRIAHGIPVGSMVEYADQATLSRAMDHRTSLS